MHAYRRAAALVAGGLFAFLLGAVLAGPAAAHGAMAAPVSRTVACSTIGGSSASSAACRAAVSASGRQSAFADWDEIRVPGIDGRDRQRIPDGKICSGGLAQFHGLDLARTDWPATQVQSGARLQFAYRTSIPHAGTFRLYVTRDGYRPTAPLTWAMVEPAAFLTVTNPPVSGGAYRFSGTLPRKAGHHVIVTIWQTTSTPDTYYSCSDVIFPAAKPAAAAPSGKATPPKVPASTGPPRTPPASRTATPAPAAVPPSPSAARPGGQPGPVPDTVDVAPRAASWTTRNRSPLIIIGAAAAAAVGALTVLLVVRRRA